MDRARSARNAPSRCSGEEVSQVNSPNTTTIVDPATSTGSSSAYGVTRRGGTVTVVGMPSWDAEVTFSAFGLFYDEKRLLGCVYGSAQVHRDFPRFVSLAETGRLDLGHMVSRRIALGEVNDAFRAMEAGEVIRSVITDPDR